MNKSKKSIMKKIMNKSNKFIKKLNKTVKNKSGLKKCDIFCKKDLMGMNKKIKELSVKFKIPYRTPTKEEDEFAYNTCKKSFCNEKCDGYDFFDDKQKQIDFKKKIKNGFQDTYSTENIVMLKKMGALSGCVGNEIYHK